MSANGPRFFAKWLTLDISAPSSVSTLYIYTKQLLLVTCYASGTVTIFEILENVEEIQTIHRQGAVSAEGFYLDGNHYLVLAVHFDNEGNSKPSVLYEWDGAKFVICQLFEAKGVTDVEFTRTHDDESLLIFSAYHDGLKTYRVPSLLYKWNKEQRKFELHQALQTTGAKKAHFFHTGQQLWLTVACEYNDKTSSTYSYVYQWNGTYFVTFQNILTHRAHDLYPVVAGNCHLFLVAINFMNDGTHNTESIVYRFSHFENRFVHYLSIATYGPCAVEYFIIHTERYVVIANSYNEETFSSRVKSKVYCVDGTKFELFQEIPTIGATDVHAFVTLKGNTVLAIANEGANVVLYKWYDVSATSVCSE